MGAVAALVERLKGNLLIRRSFVFTLGTTVTNVGNYFYHFLMGRFLGPADYGVLAVLFSLLYIVTVPANTVLTVAIKSVAAFKARERHHMIGGWWRSFTKGVLLGGASLFFAALVFSPMMAGFFNIDNNLPLILTGLVFVFIFILTLNRGVLQGLQDFANLSINYSWEAVLKVGLAVGLVVLGFGVNGAVVALVLSMAIAYLLTFIPLRTTFALGAAGDEAIRWRDTYASSAPVFLGFLFLTLLYNADIMIVKHFFEAAEAGIYAGLSLMGKIIFFSTLAVAGVMLPMVAEAEEAGKEHRKLFWHTFLIVLTASSAGVFWYFLFPDFTLSILLGAQYQAAAPYLGSFGLVMLMLSLNNVFVFYFLAQHKTKFLYPLSATAIAEVILIWLFHASIAQIILILITLHMLLLGAFFLAFFYDGKGAAASKT